MGKITEALKKAAEERLARIGKLDRRDEVKYQFVAKKTVESNLDPRIVSFYEPSSTVAEQYRILRTNLLSLNTKTPIKAITITSALHGEGKTITALNLAVTMANDLAKKNILLVDGDLRRGRISRYLGVKTETGLADVLSDGTNIDDALLNIGVDNLSILPSGKTPKNPAELLGSNKMKNLISALKSKYDYVIFDTTPVISLTDAGVLGAQTDGVAMVIHANRTQKGVIKHAEDLLRQTRAKVIGYILTNIQYHIPQYIYRYL